MANAPKPSLVDEYEATDEGKLGLAAAKLAAEAKHAIDQAYDLSPMVRFDLADKLGVSVDLVGRLLESDGNMHVAVLARLMRALGYEVTLSVRPIEPGVPELPASVSRANH